MVESAGADLVNGDGHNVRTAISREMVSLMKEYLGRGPTHAHTYIRDNLIVCVMEDTMTKAEATLASNGDRLSVREIRRTYQDAFRDDAVAIVERHVPTKVVSFMSDHDIAKDVSAEIFVLEPGLDGGLDEMP